MVETDIRVSLIIPAYNEEKIIIKTIDTALAYFFEQGYNFELIVVDDASTDKTPELVKGYLDKYACVKLLVNNHNRGKGFSVNRGVLSANGKYIIFSDADLSTPIEEAGRLLHFLSLGYNIAIGSRVLESSRVKVKQPWFRIIMGKVFNIFIRSILSVDIRDTQCGFKGFEARVAKKIFSMQKMRGFSFDVELLYLAKLLGCSVKEMPVSWANRRDSRVRILSDSFKMAVDILKIRINGLKRVYQNN